MKIKKGFIKKPIMDQVFVVPTEDAAKNFSGMIKLNETASLIWDMVSDEKEIDEIAKALTQKYDIDYNTAMQDTLEVINQMKEQGFFEE